MRVNTRDANIATGVSFPTVGQWPVSVVFRCPGSLSLSLFLSSLGGSRLVDLESRRKRRRTGRLVTREINREFEKFER